MLYNMKNDLLFGSRSVCHSLYCMLEQLCICVSIVILHPCQPLPDFRIQEYSLPLMEPFIIDRILKPLDALMTRITSGKMIPMEIATNKNHCSMSNLQSLILQRLHTMILVRYRIITDTTDFKYSKVQSVLYDSRKTT